MKSKFLFTAALTAVVLTVQAFGHDLFLKLDSFFVAANSKVTINILNGTFMASEGAVNFARLREVSIVAPDGARTNPVEANFTKNETTSFLNLDIKDAGTYVAGMSTMEREIDLEGNDFNEYLSHDGIPDTLAERKAKKELDKKVRERYSKHVKAIFQAGDVRTDSFKTVLGYPVELVPQQNPYKLKSGSTIEILCLKDGRPLVNQFVQSGREFGGKAVAGQDVRTDKKGIAKFKLSAAGKWYVRFINMTRLDDPKVNYESKWATLTFEIK
jgi:uncharacterized GH25 family protein